MTVLRPWNVSRSQGTRCQIQWVCTGFSRDHLPIQMTLITEEYSEAEIHPSLQTIHFPPVMPTEIAQPEGHQTTPGRPRSGGCTKPHQRAPCARGEHRHRVGWRDVPWCAPPAPSSSPTSSARGSISELTALDGVFIHQSVIPNSGIPSTLFPVNSTG